jgi:hypothetical protein
MRSEFPIAHEYNKGALIYSCIVVIPEGVPLGVLSQKIYTRPQRKDDSADKEEKKRRPIEEKESNRWLETMREANSYVPTHVNAIHICDREGDFYEFYAQAMAIGCKFIVRAVQNRIVQEHQKSFAYMKGIPPCGNVTAHIPRDTRNGVKARDATLEVRFASVTFKKPKSRREAHLPSEITATMVHVIETAPPKGSEAIAWFLLTSETVGDFHDAVRIVEYYVQRWKIERFHYVLKTVTVHTPGGAISRRVVRLGPQRLRTKRTPGRCFAILGASARCHPWRQPHHSPGFAHTL